MKKKRSAALRVILTAALLSGIAMTGGCSGTEETNQEEETNMSTEIKSVDINGKKMKYFSFGNKDGEKLVVLPGLSLKSVMGSADAIVQAYALPAEKYELYFFDRLDELPEGYDIAQMAQDTLHALKVLNLDQVHIMGVSLGGMIALTMAADSPETVKSLVLCSTACRIRDDSKPVFENWRRLAEERNLNGLMEAFGADVYTPSFFEQYREIIIASGEGATEPDYRNFLTALKGTAEFDLSGRMKQISCPAYVLGASEDRILGAESSYELMDQLNCSGYIYEGYGHGVYDEAPDYLMRVTDFLNSVK